MSFLTTAGHVLLVSAWKQVTGPDMMTTVETWLWGFDWVHLEVMLYGLTSYLQVKRWLFQSTSYQKTWAVESAEIHDWSGYRTTEHKFHASPFFSKDYHGQLFYHDNVNCEYMNMKWKLIKWRDTKLTALATIKSWRTASLVYETWPKILMKNNEKD